jgi:hypothetical protein
MAFQTQNFKLKSKLGLDQIVLTTKANYDALTKYKKSNFNDQTHKAWIRDLNILFKKLKEDEPDRKYMVEWLTEDGFVTTNIISNDVRELFLSPKFDDHEASGGEGNRLHGKDIIATRVTLF